ncbi:aldo/keto reductase [Actinomadura litoris]|uniref:aldo/keto reductase n=1 Tax=Actinomadura litoris TaxID=2678616 RepID=UPI001FA6BC78|nr:aldo/keto reductase [Actinomadura litoris]
MTFIDSADSHGPGANEKLPAEALHPYPQDLVIGTEAGQSRPSARAAPGQPSGVPAAAGRTQPAPLRLERIDLLQLPRTDPKVPVYERFGALSSSRTRAGSATSRCRR